MTLTSVVQFLGTGEAFWCSSGALCGFTCNTGSFGRSRSSRPLALANRNHSDDIIMVVGTRVTGKFGMMVDVEDSLLERM